MQISILKIKKLYSRKVYGISDGMEILELNSVAICF